MVQELIGKITLGRNAELRFEISPYRGKQYINIRRFVDSPKFKGYTKKGITLTPELASQLLDGLNKYKQNYKTQYKNEICRIPKNETVKIIATIILPDDNHNSACFDVREYVQSENYTGWTQKGFRLSLEEMDNVISFLQQCLSKLNHKPFSEDGDFSESDNSVSDNTGNLINELLPDGVPIFPKDFLPQDQIIDDNAWIRLELPPEPIKLGAMRGTQQEIVSDAGFEYLANNPVEAKFIIYAHQHGNEEAFIPRDQFLTFQIVKKYEVLVRDIKKQLIQMLIRRTKDKVSAAKIVKKVFRENALPYFEE